jgi:hypothetical protein
MDWRSIDSQDDLDELAKSTCWEDSETLEFYATQAGEDYFPTDVSRSGYTKMNLHFLLDACSAKQPYLEMVFIDCDRTDIHFLTHFVVCGRTDGLKRVELQDGKGQTQLRCSRLIYRFLEDSDIIRSRHYFQTKDTEPSPAPYSSPAGSESGEA